MKPTLEELMKPSYESVGITQAGGFLPLTLRRALAYLCSFHPLLLTMTLWVLHQLFGWLGIAQSNQVAREWCRMARQLQLKDAWRLASAIAALDPLPTFGQGARQQGNRNTIEFMFLRSGFLDIFFRRYPIQADATSHPLQRPYYSVPGIPCHRYYSPRDFPWAQVLEDNYAVIEAELRALLQDPQGFGSYQTEIDTSMPGWNTFPLWLYGERHAANALRCPRTVQLLESLPGFENGEWIHFSALNPQSQILPHVGPLNGVLRAHLAMMIPAACGIRVGGQEQAWETGKVMVFDDSFVHEVWNRSDHLRVVLFLNFWHPCLSQSEREALARLRQAYHDTPTGRRWMEHQENARPATLQNT